jgi:hypothetical protein
LSGSAGPCRNASIGDTLFESCPDYYVIGKWSATRATTERTWTRSGTKTIIRQTAKKQLGACRLQTKAAQTASNQTKQCIRKKRYTIHPLPILRLSTLLRLVGGSVWDINVMPLGKKNGEAALTWLPRCCRELVGKAPQTRSNVRKLIIHLFDEIGRCTRPGALNGSWSKKWLTSPKTLKP